MTIINGFKMESKNGWYRAVRTEQEAKDRAASDVATWSEYTLTPVRYVAYGRSHGWVFIDNQNLIRALYQIFSRNTYIMSARNPYTSRPENATDTFESNVEAGKSYLVGSDVDTKHFLKTHTSSCSDWQVLAHEWAMAHPDEMLVIETGGKRKFVWHVCKRGNYIEFGMPYHTQGGEKYYISQEDNPTRKVLVNVD